MKLLSYSTLLALLFTSQLALGDTLPTLNTKTTSKTTSSSTTKTTSKTTKTTSTSSTHTTHASSHISITSSSSLHSSTTSASHTSSHTSYTYTAIVPKVKSPYTIKYHDLSGSVFIAVGSIIFSILFLLAVLRFWLHYKSRRDAYKSDKFEEFYNDSGDHFGGGSGEKHKSGFFAEKSMNDYESTLLPYDSHIFASKRSLLDDNLSEMVDLNDQSTVYQTKTNNSLPLNSHSYNTSTTDMQDFSSSVSQPGHQLRKALNMNSSSSLPLTTKTPQQKRFSFISPINDLISQTQQFQQPTSYMNFSPQGESFLDSSSPNVTINDNKSIYMHDTNSSGHLISDSNLGLGLGLMNNNNSSISHQRQPSNYEEFYSIIEKSLIKSGTNTASQGTPNNGSPSTPVNDSFTKAHKRPPSMQLDDLLKGSPL